MGRKKNVELLDLLSLNDASISYCCSSLTKAKRIECKREREREREGRRGTKLRRDWNVRVPAPQRIF